MKLFRLICISICSQFVLQSFAQDNLSLIIWDFKGDCKYVRDGVNSIKDIDKSMLTFGSDSAILAYIGNDINNPKEFKPPLTALSIEYDEIGTFIINSMFPVNDTIGDYSGQSMPVIPGESMPLYQRTNG